MRVDAIFCGVTISDGSSNFCLNTGHKECAGDQGEACKDPSLGNLGHKIGGGLINLNNESQLTVAGMNEFVCQSLDNPEEQEKLMMILAKL
jgi:hypothetical protein